MHSFVRALVVIVAFLLVASMVVYALISLPEGDPALALLGHRPWAEDLRALNRDLGDRPVVTRYLIWLSRVINKYVRRSSSTEGALALHLPGR